METINKLLQKQAPKGKGKAAGEGGDGQDAADAANVPPAVFVRWTSNAQGSRVGVPRQMLDGPAGAVFGGPSTRVPAEAVAAAPRLLIEEVL